MATVFGLWSCMGMDPYWPVGQRQVGLRNVNTLIGCGVQEMLHRYRLERINLVPLNLGGMIFGLIFSLILKPRVAP
tara:strand:- start:506 stop:733 length:228 start_codon:yes stop_codon:yes gene_type:complete